jgi:hypothetical protein
LKNTQRSAELTIRRWSELDDNTILELEHGEDIDVVQRAFSRQDLRTLEQVKLRSNSVSLRSPEILESLVHFWLHSRNNTEGELRFRYFTNARPATERGVDFGGKLPALEVWQRLSSGRLAPADRLKFLEAIRAFLQKVSRPQEISSADWDGFQNFLSGSTAISPFAERVEWSFGNPDVPDLAAEVEDALRASGYIESQEAPRVHADLVVFVIQRLAADGLKQLTRAELISLLREAQKSSVNASLLGMVKMLIEQAAGQNKVVGDLSASLFSITQSKSEVPVEFASSLPTAISVVPPAVVSGCKRSETVNKLRQALDRVAWLALQGESGVGKTQLAVLLAEGISRKHWISFRNAPLLEMGKIFDSYLAFDSRLRYRGEMRGWYTEICGRLAPGTTFFLDDIPEDANSELGLRLSVFAQSAADRGVKIVSTAWNSIVPSPAEHLGVAFQEISVPRFSNEEIKEYLSNRNAPSQLLSSDTFLRLVGSATRGHPLLLVSLVRYMEKNGWAYDAELIQGLLRRDFAEDIRLRTQKVLSQTLPESTRELLYRLNVVGPGITREDVVLTGRVTPPIALPIDKLAECIGAWVHVVAPDTFTLSPLVEQLGTDNILPETRQVIHLEKARAIVSKKVLDQFDAIAAIQHFENGAAPEEAALVLLGALHKLNARVSAPIDDFGLLDIWTRTELPEGVPFGLQLLVLALQVSARKRRSKTFLELLPRFDRRLRQQRAGDELTVLGSCALMAIALADTDARTSVRYAVAALEVEPEGEELPAQIAYARTELVWACSPLIQTPTDLRDWLNTVGQLPKPQIGALFKSPLAAAACRHICDGFWTREADKLTPQWDSLDTELEAIAVEAQKLEASILVAALTRARIVIAGDYRKDIFWADQLARIVVTSFPENSAAKFLVAHTMGSTACDLEEWDIAIDWLDSSLAEGGSSFAEFFTRGLLCRALASSKKGASARTDLLRAIAFARGNQNVSELMLIRCLGEYSIACWEEDDGPGFFEAWQEAVERLLAARTDNNAWKELFVLCGNNTGFFAAKDKSVQSSPNITRPFQGIYLLYTPKLAELYAPETEWWMPASLVWLAQRIGRYEESTRWALTAVKSAAGSPLGGNAGAVLLYATPAAIREGRYSEALEFVSQAIKAMSASDETLLDWAKTRNNEELQRTIEERPKQTPSPDFYLSMLLTPIIVEVLTLHLRDSAAATRTGTSIASTCRELSADVNDAWSYAAETLDLVLADNTTVDRLVEAGQTHTNAGRNVAAIVCALGTARAGEPTQTAFHWLRALEYYERNFSALTLHMRLLTERVISYWSVALELAPTAFRQPATLKRKLAELAVENATRPRHVMRIVVWHLAIGVAPPAKEWLERP